MPQQGDGEGRRPRRVRLESRRGRGLDRPSGHGGARLRRGLEPDHDERDAGGLRGQRQPARGGEVERPGLAPDLDERCSQGRAARRLLGGAQDVGRDPRPHQRQPAGIEPEGGEAGLVGQARLAVAQILAHPQQRTLTGSTEREPEREADGRGLVGGAAEHLVQGGARQLARRRPGRCSG